MFIPFIDILYSLAIGTGFTYFPEFPLQNLPGTAIFLFTLLVAAQDWYEYHDKANIIPKSQELQYHLWQILVVLALNQMFRHSTAVSLQSWLVYFGIFAVLNAFWNAFTRFSNHWLFVGTTSLLAVGNIAAGVYYQGIVALLPSIDGRWIMLICESLLIGLGLIFIKLFNR